MHGQQRCVGIGAGVAHVAFGTGGEKSEDVLGRSDIL